MEKILLDLRGNAIDNSPCLSTGYGYFAYTNTRNSFLRDLIQNMSIWNGATKTFDMIDGDFYSGYELDCRDKGFYKSDTFKKICWKCGVELVVCEEDMKPMREFFDNVYRR